MDSLDQRDRRLHEVNDFGGHRAEHQATYRPETSGSHDNGIGTVPLHMRSDRRSRLTDENDAASDHARRSQALLRRRQNLVPYLLATSRKPLTDIRSVASHEA